MSIKHLVEVAQFMCLPMYAKGIIYKVKVRIIGLLDRRRQKFSQKYILGGKRKDQKVAYSLYLMQFWNFHIVFSIESQLFWARIKDNKAILRYKNFQSEAPAQF